MGRSAVLYCRAGAAAVNGQPPARRPACEALNGLLGLRRPAIPRASVRTPRGSYGAREFIRVLQHLLPEIARQLGMVSEELLHDVQRGGVRLSVAEGPQPRSEE